LPADGRSSYAADVSGATPQPSLRTRAALATVRSVLAGLVVVAALGTFAAVIAYRADVAEVRAQVRDRVIHQGRLYADSLALHFEVLRVELQRLADRGYERLRLHDAEVQAGIREDRALFGEGVALLDLSGRVVWSQPADAVRGELGAQPWFQRVLAQDRPAIDELRPDESSALAVALPVHDDGRLAGVLVGIVRGSDRLSLGVEAQGEHLMVLSSQERVLVPLAEPAWSRSAAFREQVQALVRSGGEAPWALGEHDSLAAAFPVRGTSLQVLSLQSEENAIAPIRRRLNAQLAFLLVVQLVALGAFVVFLRRTWRAFLEAEAHTAEQDKMAALGAAASLIAHEVKNSLNGLKAASSLLSAGGDAAFVARSISGQVDRLGHLARSLLSFARPEAICPVPVKVDALVREAVEGLATLPERPECDVSLRLAEGLEVRTDPLLLTTAVDNLVRNAIEAAVAAKDLGRTAQPRVVVEAQRVGDEVEVSVEDNAGPAPAELEARLGEPFFTTKSKGIGLGLAMTRRALEQLGAKLVFTRLDTGSRFVVHLPTRPPEAT
jgi:signal transduction histidine kinase